jgi:protein gp37
MSERTSIEWTDAIWNPVRGCTKISLGCKFCYAEAFAERFRGVPGHPFEQGFDLRLVAEKLPEPLKWKRPRRIFVNSMSDLFHEDVPDTYIAMVFSIIEKADWHVFQVLTKRAERLHKIADALPWPANLWMGVSIESARYARRARLLANTPAKTRFISAEPLLGPIPNLPLEGVHWVIVGGESGRFARPMDLSWAREIRDQCKSARVAFFLKQLGGRTHKRGGDQAILDGRKWREFPASTSSLVGLGV